MANLPETEDFAEGTYQIETSDRVLGGPGGIANKQAEQLGNRTAWLRAAIRKIIEGTTAIGRATQLATARTLRFKGAVSGSGSFDGSADTEITLTLADSGIAPGSYTKITLNAKGLAVAGISPTTLDGYGITDAFTKPETAAAVQQAISNLVASSPAALDTLKELADALGNDPNFATTITNALALKANRATTLDGYGITDGATKTELSNSVGNLLPRAGGVMSGSIMMDNGTADTPEIAWRSPSLDIRADVVDKVLRFFAVLGGQTTFPLTLDVANKVVELFGNAAWHAGNFKPDDKADKVQASESASGIAKVASAALVAGLVDDKSFITPLKLAPLANKVSALEGRQMFTKAFTSPEHTITTGGYLTIPHGLGGPLVLWEGYLVCRESEHGYWPGATLIVPCSAVDNLYNLGVSIAPDETNLNCKFGSQPGVFFVLEWSTGSTKIITPSKWRFVVRAWS